MRLAHRMDKIEASEAYRELGRRSAAAEWTKRFVRAHPRNAAAHSGLCSFTGEFGEGWEVRDPARREEYMLLVEEYFQSVEAYEQATGDRRVWG